MRNNVFFMILIFQIFLGNPGLGSYAGRGISVNSFNKYSRITIPVKPTSTFNVENFDQAQNELTLSIANMSENYWTQTNALSDRLVRDVRTSSNEGAKLSISIGIRNTSTEHFVYYQPNPPSVIVDIWESGGKKSSQAKASAGKKIARKLPNSVKPNSTVQKERVIASVAKKVAKVTPISFDNDLFYDLPMIIPSFSYKGENFNTSTEMDPGAGWDWSKPDMSIPGGTNFSLAAKLYKRGQCSLAIRSVEYARRDYSDSPYMDELEFLEALCYRRLSIATGEKAMNYKARDRFKELMLRQKDGKYLPFSKKLRIFFASQAFRDGRWLDAISHFEFILDSPDGEKESDLPGIKLANAEAYLNLQQYGRAARIYRNIVQEYEGKWSAKEAKYRLGNTLAIQKTYSKADAALKDALQTYPDYESTRSEAYYNLAESNFVMKNFADARKYFEIYLKNHGSQTYAANALVRLGEIAEIIDKDVNKSRELYLSAINRFPFSLGEKLAQIRIARLDFFENKDPDYQISRLRNNVNSRDIPQQVKEMSSIQLIRYLNRNGQPEEAISLAQAGIARSEGENYKIFKSIYIETLLLNMEGFLERGESAEALTFYDKYKEWLEQASPEIWLILAKAYKSLNLFSTSSTFMGRYIQASRESNSRVPSSFGRTRDDALFVKARLLYLQAQYQQAIDNLVGNQSFDADHLRMQCYMRMGDNTQAMKIAAKFKENEKQVLQGKSKAERDAIRVDVAEVFLEHHQARKEYQPQIEILKQVSEVLNEPNERFRFRLADMYWYKQDFPRAIPAYQEALNLFPKSERANRANYRLGLAFHSVGDTKMAVKTLTPLAENSQNIWGQSATQELNLIQWEEKYSVILGDLPPAGLGMEL